MARRGVNAAVTFSCVATMAASTLGVVAADGYWPGSHAAPSLGPELNPRGRLNDDVTLSPLPPMQLAPLDASAVSVPAPRVQSAPPGLVQAPTPASAPPRPARRTRAS